MAEGRSPSRRAGCRPPGGACGVLAGGGLEKAGVSLFDGLPMWNGSSWSGLGSWLNNSVLALAVSGSDVYAGGRFTTAGGTAAYYIAKWNGSTWTPLGSGMRGSG